jgi:hypothetical protein
MVFNDVAIFLRMTYTIAYLNGPDRIVAQYDNKVSGNVEREF